MKPATAVVAVGIGLYCVAPDESRSLFNKVISVISGGFSGSSSSSTGMARCAAEYAEASAAGLSSATQPIACLAHRLLSSSLQPGVRQVACMQGPPTLLAPQLPFPYVGVCLFCSICSMAG